MVNVQDIPAVRELIEQEEARKVEQAEQAPQTVRAPEGNGHEAAVRHLGGQR